MGPMNSAKSAVRPINSSKNKLNSKIIYNFNPPQNARIVANQTHSSLLKSPKSLTFSWPPSLFMCSKQGQNGQIPSIVEIFREKTLFRNKMVIYHFFWYSSSPNSSTIFSIPPWHDDMES